MRVRIMTVRGALGPAGVSDTRPHSLCRRGDTLNRVKPHAAAVAAQARIAEAQRDQEATEAEQVANAKKAAAIRGSQIQQAGYQAEVDEAKAKASQAGPLSEATARQEVVVQETRAAQF